MSPDDRFLAKIDRDASGCWLWTGGTVRGGYGQFWLNGKHVYAHRYAYETLVGPIPDGLQVDHLCRTPACVRPSHLQPVTCRENLMRGNTIAAAHAAGRDCGFACNVHRRNPRVMVK